MFCRSVVCVLGFLSQETQLKQQDSLEHLS